MSRRVFILVLVAAAVVAYIPKVFSPFFWDDYQFIVNSERTQNFFDRWVEYLVSPRLSLYRPFRDFLYGLLFELFGLRAWLWHVAGIALHAITTLLVFSILQRLLKLEVAFMSALIFTLHPALTERVVLITGSMDIWGIAFALAAFALHLNGRRRSVAVLSAFLFTLAVFSSEEAVVFALAIALYHFLAAEGVAFGRRVRTSLARALPFLLIALVYLVVRYVVLGHVARASVAHSQRLWLLASIPAALCLNVLKLLFPVAIIPDYPKLLGAGSVALGFLGLVVVLVVFVASRPARHELFLAGWFVVALLPFLNIFPIGNLMANRYLYHAAIPFFGLLFSLLTARLPMNRLIPFACAVALIFGISTFHWSGITSKPIAYWERAARINPDSFAANYNLAMHLYNRRDIAGAYRYCRKATEIDPDSVRATRLLAMVLSAMGRHDEALRAFERVLELDPADERARLGVLRYRGLRMTAEEVCRQATDIAPNSVDAWNICAYFFARAKNYEQARRWYEKIIREGSDPMSREVARRNLERLGDEP